MIPVLLLLAVSGLTPLTDASYRGMMRSYRGNVVLVNFWATWCAPCRDKLPVLAGLQKKYPELRVVTVSTDEPEQAAEAEKLLRQARVEGKAYIRDSEIPDEKFIPTVDPKWSGALPAAFLYGRDGKVIRSFIGEPEADELEASVRRALAER